MAVPTWAQWAAAGTGPAAVAGTIRVMLREMRKVPGMLVPPFKAMSRSYKRNMVGGFADLLGQTVGSFNGLAWATMTTAAKNAVLAHLDDR